MNIMKSVNDASKVLKTFGKTLSDHRPELKVGFGIAGNFLALFWMYKKAPEIKEGLEEKDYLKAAKAASAPVLTAIGSNVSIGSGFIDIKKDLNTAATAYAITDTMLQQRMTAEKEVLTKGKQQDVEHQIAKDIVETEGDLESKYPIFLTGQGNSLIYDPLSRRLFRGDIARVYDAFMPIAAAVTAGDRGYMDEFWSTFPGIPVIGYEHFAGFDIEKGIPELRLEPVDRGPNSEILHVMMWKNVAYF